MLKKPQHAPLIIHGRAVYMPTPDGFRELTVPDVDANTPADVWAGAAADVVAGWCEESGVRSVTIVSDSDGIEHSVYDVPAKLAKIRTELPKILSEQITLGENEMLGWSVEPTWPAGSVHRTLLHAESLAVIRPIVDRLTAGKITVRAAVPWFTAIETILRKTTKPSPSQPLAALAFTASGCAYAILSPAPKRAAGFLSETRLDDLNHLLDEAGFGTHSGFVSRGPAPRLFIADLDGSTERLALNDENGLIRNFRNMKVDTLSPAKICERLATIRVSASANMADAFPHPFDMTPLLKAVAVVAILVSLGLGTAMFMSHQNLATLRAAHTAQMGQLAASAKSLQDNKNQMMAIGSHFSDKTLSVPRGRLVALETLAKATPMNITLTRFQLDDASNYIIEAMVVGARNDDEAVVDATNFRKSLIAEGFGLSARSDKAWSYDSRMRTIRMMGDWAKGKEMRSLSGFPIKNLTEMKEDAP